MEKHEQTQPTTFTQIDINLLLENTINKTGDIFVCDDVLLNKIEKYIHSEGILKRGIKSQILARFLKNSDDKFDTSNDNWIFEFNKFIELIGKDKGKVISELSKNLSLNLFRNNENLKKIKYVKENSDITDDIILIAKNLSINNGYHNFGHEIGVAETVIKLCKEENVDKKTLNLLVLAALFHDSGYTKQYEIDLEKLACNLCNTYIPNNVFKQLNITREDLNNLILMTKISNRSINNQEFIKILQDSDLGGLGYGPYYILYSCMGMIDEGIISLDNFIEDVKFFIKNNYKNGQFFLSKAGNDKLKDPMESLNIIEGRPKSAIKIAYQLRNKDITFEEFKKEIDNILKS